MEHDRNLITHVWLVWHGSDLIGVYGDEDDADAKWEEHYVVAPEAELDTIRVERRELGA